MIADGVRFAAGLCLAMLLPACMQATAPPNTTLPEVAAAVALIGNVQPAAAADIPPDQVRPASGERPQLDVASAAQQDVAQYLAQGPTPWVPEALAGRRWQARFTVAADGSGTHRRVQAAIDDVPLRSADAARVVIRVQPGVYRERVCVPAGKAPITLVGDEADPSAVVIVGSAYGGQAKRAGVDIAHLCQPDLALPIMGTLGSATVIVAADDFQAAHLTVANDALESVRLGVGYPPGASESGGAQGVALTVQADRVQLERVRLIGHQDTLQARRARPGDAARTYVHDSLIAGDVDFIFGSGTLVIDHSTLLNRGGRRRPPNGGHVLAPSTPAGVALGFLVTRSRFLAEPGAPLAHVGLGRAWDEGVARGTWQPGSSPNGQALIRHSMLGPHLALQAPWAASTSRRPFTAHGPQAARMAEFDNTVLGGDPLAREVPPPWDGWAATGGGVTGGATAAAADVHEVRTRAELVAALVPHPRPRILRVHGRIDLASDDQGRPLGEADFRDPAFDRAAFERAYAPAAWGRQPLTGPLEEARQRSARRQAAHVVLRVPSRTTLIGATREAHLTGGMLMLDGVDDVIVRRLRLSDAYDHFPAWDPNDNAGGEWNSDYDNLSLRGASRVWVDHCSFDDGDRPDAAEPLALGRRLQRHDGLLDITRQSDRVTVSWSHFSQHAKTMLIGSGDKVRQDDGKLRVTLHHNHWVDLGERTPRVRWGRVHVVNNLFEVRAASAYPYGYSLGVGVGSRLFSEHNAWDTPAALPATRLVKLWRGTRFADRGSWHNGQPVDLLAALRQADPGVAIDGDVGWFPPGINPPDPASAVAQRVRGRTGPGGL